MKRSNKIVNEENSFKQPVAPSSKVQNNNEEITEAETKNNPININFLIS